MVLATTIAMILSDFVLKSINAIWSPWNYYMRELLNRPILRDAVRGEEPDFSQAARAAAKVAREFEGDWKGASRSWQLWEKIQRVKTRIGKAEMALTVCPDMVSVESGKGVEETGTENGESVKE
jgi:hypothetical protein